MPARSPHRHSPVPAPPAPPRISRRTPPLPMKRGRSADRQGVGLGPGPSRRREFRERSPPRRQSRSPIRRGGPKGPPIRDFPDPKRKLSPPPPKKNRREGRRPGIGSPEIKQTRSKSPIGRDRGNPRSFGDAPGNSAGYSSGLDSSQGRLTRTVGSGDRFRGGADYEEETALDRPIFRGPEGTVRFDSNELKRISVEIVRRNLLPPETQVINRSIVNPEDITPVRRPDEGSRPIFERDELMNSDRSLAPPVEQRRIVAMPPVRSRSPADRERSRIRSPGPSRDPHGFPYPERERERSPYDSRSHPREFDARDKRGERYQSRDDLRHELDQRRRDEPLPSHYRQSEYRESSSGYNRPRDNESDLRARISEKRNDPHLRHDERERERDRDRERHEIEREKHRPLRSSPPLPPPSSRDRRRGSPDFRPSHTYDRDARDRELWERERERSREREREREREGVDRKRRGRSREREEERRGGAGGSRRHSSLERFTDSSDRKERHYNKPDSDYEHHTEREFYERDEFSGSNRGARGGPSMRRMVPHPGPRGMPPRFRPPVMAMRMPPIIPMRGGFRPILPHAFSPRKSPEPTFRRGKNF